MNYTTIEQSKALIEAGLNPKTADCCWIISRDNCKQEPFELAKNENTLWLYPIDKIRGNLSDYMLPCWSTGALIDILPKVILHDRIFYKLVTFHDISAIQYSNLDKDKVLNTEVWNTVDPKSQGYLYGLIKMILWCLENGYIEKKEE